MEVRDLREQLSKQLRQVCTRLDYLGALKVHTTLDVARRKGYVPMLLRVFRRIGHALESRLADLDGIRRPCSGPRVESAVGWDDGTRIIQISGREMGGGYVGRDVVLLRVQLESAVQ